MIKIVKKVMSSYNAPKVKIALANFAFELGNRAIHTIHSDDDGNAVDVNEAKRIYVNKKIFANKKSHDAVKKDDKKYDTNIIDNVQNFIISNGETNPSGGFFAMWALRNNLFHGTKDYTELTNQIELFATMNTLLKEIMV